MKFERFGYTIGIEQKALQDGQRAPKRPARSSQSARALRLQARYKPEKTEATRHATQVRQNSAKEKIQNTINLLRLEEQDIMAYRVAKTAGVSYNTAKKYLKEKK